MNSCQNQLMWQHTFNSSQNSSHLPFPHVAPSLLSLSLSLTHTSCHKGTRHIIDTSSTQHQPVAAANTCSFFQCVIFHSQSSRSPEATSTIIWVSMINLRFPMMCSSSQWKAPPQPVRCTRLSSLTLTVLCEMLEVRNEVLRDVLCLDHRCE
jgi:hypothetical protein